MEIESFAPQRSAASSSVKIPEKRHLVCYHDEIAPLRTVKVNGPTLGRRFYGCNYWPLICGFFKWEDEVNDLREWQWKVFERDSTIAELKQENAVLQAEINILKGKQTTLIDDLVVARTEAATTTHNLQADALFWKKMVAFNMTSVAMLLAPVFLRLASC